MSGRLGLSAPSLSPLRLVNGREGVAQIITPSSSTRSLIPTRIIQAAGGSIPKEASPGGWILNSSFHYVVFLCAVIYTVLTPVRRSDSRKRDDPPCANLKTASSVRV